MATTIFSFIVISVILIIGFGYSTDGHDLPNGGKIWALLVAGSNGFYNYRHQADLCHAYQILHNNGIPDDNIIVMMYDDIANSSDNPTPGVIINEPNGTDVYKGVLKDYTGADVNPANFLKVLAGDAKGMNGIGSGRVLKTGPNDHIFVNFVDHGAPGLLAFPSEELYAIDLRKTLMDMAANKKFAKMVMYIEACESGSMFDAILPDNLNIFVTTAADPRESSYACYFDDLRQTYLGDVFSVNWMLDTEHEVVLRETLHHQFEVVRTMTNTSHVEEYGDLDLGAMHVSDFIGFRMSGLANTPTERRTVVSPLEDAVPSPHVPVTLIHKKLERTNDPAEVEKLYFELHTLMKKRAHLENVTMDILERVTRGDTVMLNKLKTSHHSLSLSNFECYKTLASHYSATCFKFSEHPYALRQLYLFVNICAERVYKEDVVITAMNRTCAVKTVLGGIV